MLLGRATCFSIIALVVAFCQVRTPAELPFGTERFHRAFYDERSREIRWESFQPVNWEAKARIYLKTFSIDRPTPAQIRRLKDKSTPEVPGLGILEFVAPLESGMAQAGYLVLSGAGVGPVRTVQLRGVASLQFDESFSKLQEKNFSGEVAGTSDTAMSDAAFVIVARPGDVSSVRRDATFSVQKAAGTGREIICRLEENGRISSWRGRLDIPTDVERTLSFRLAEGRFLLVQWKPDSSNCAYQYVLFSTDGGLRPIAWNLYGCDV